MSALGIGVCTSDKAYGWEEIKPVKLNEVQLEYRRAIANAEHAWRQLTRDTDKLIAEGRYEEIEERTENCKALDQLVHRLSPHSRTVVEK